MGMSETLTAYRPGYVDAIGPNGTPTKHNGDYVARRLLKKTPEEIHAFVMGRTGKSYAHLNNGQIRMNCGNVIRGLYRERDDATRLFLRS